MLFTLFLVVITYLLAAESFTHFLFPAPGQVADHFQAGALPVAAVRCLGIGVCLGHHSWLDSDLCREPWANDRHAGMGEYTYGFVFTCF